MAINPLSPNAIGQALFKRNDTSKTGKLTESQFAQTLAQTQGKQTADVKTTAQAKALFLQLDKDVSGTVDLSEFEAANLAAATSTSKAGPNLYQALQSAGIAQSNNGSNIYSNLLFGSLNGTFNQTGALVGQLVGGAITNKIA